MNKGSLLRVIKPALAFAVFEESDVGTLERNELCVFLCFEEERKTKFAGALRWIRVLSRLGFVTVLSFTLEQEE